MAISENYEARRRAGLRKLVVPEFTAHLRLGSARLIVSDESLIPSKFWVEQRLGWIGSY